MLDLYKQCGVFAHPLLIISIVNCVLVIRCITSLSKGAIAPKLPHAINAILFWGGVSAALGFLGQYSGLYNALGAISRATKISPYLVARGLAESFTTVIFGLTILVLSALAWFALSAWHRRVAGDNMPS
jgi:uncharacterized membrane protein